MSDRPTKSLTAPQIPRIPTVRSERSQTILLLCLTFGCILPVQSWIATVGWHTWPQTTNYTSRLAAAFLHGQLSLLTRPSPALLALPDPYDPFANAKLRLHDASLYHGKYYLYWGPVPALLTTAVCLPLGIRNPDFNDVYLAVALPVGICFLSALLLLSIRRQLFADQPIESAAAPIFCFGLGGPMLYALSEPAIYDVNLCAAQFFLLAGLLITFHALCRRSSIGWFAAAGCCWAMCIGSRVTLLPAIVAVQFLTIFQLFRNADRRAAASRAAILLTPLLIAAALLGWYNQARFQSWTEFGMRWQLAGRDQRAVPPPGFFSLRYFPCNLFLYLLVPPRMEMSFPFLYRNRSPGWFALALKAWPVYQAEGLVGLIWTQPFVLLLAPIAPWALRRRSETQGGAGISVWIVAGLSALVILGASPVLCFWFSTMRYQWDALPALTLLSGIGYWTLLRAVQDRPRLSARIRSIAALAILGQIVLSLLLAMAGPANTFRFYNPPLFHALYRYFDGPW